MQLASVVSSARARLRVAVADEASHLVPRRGEGPRETPADEPGCAGDQRALTHAAAASAGLGRERRRQALGLLLLEAAVLAGQDPAGPLHDEDGDRVGAREARFSTTFWTSVYTVIVRARAAGSGIPRLMPPSMNHRAGP